MTVAENHSEMAVTVYTVGHSNHESLRFLDLLSQHGIEAVADVRSSPYSRYVPQANRETLAHTLRAAGITYSWFGPQLGGKPDGDVADYEKLRLSMPFQEGLDELLALAAESQTAIMCSEGDHRSCHRYKLITPALQEREIRVLHIQPDGSLVDEDDIPKQLSLF
jgi:uncharacterized protein (DUF488 family)